MNQIQTVHKKAYDIRKDVLKMLAKAGSGHMGASLGLAEVFSVLYFDFLNHRPDNPEWPERDRFVLSIGHVAPALYATLAHAGYFPKEELNTLRQLGSRLQGHPAKDVNLPGLETASGSLGHGLSIACGMALSAKIDRAAWRVVSLHGDGELQEGSIWEAAMGAAHHILDNLTAIVDRNKVQIDGQTEKVMRLEPLSEKWQAFGWEVFHCDGNDVADIKRALMAADQQKGKPSVILARTEMCRGIRELEGNHLWHGKAPSEEQLGQFLEAVEKDYKKRVSGKNQDFNL